MESKDPLYIAKQLLLYKQDKLSSEERSEVEHLLAQDSVLKQMADDLDDSHKLNEDLAIMDSFDTEAALAKQKMFFKKQHGLPIVKNAQSFSRLLWVAASIVLLAISFIVFRTYVIPDNQPHLLSKKVGDEIKLRLASGKELSLDTLFSTTNNELILSNKEGELSVASESISDEEKVELNTLIVPYQRTYRLVLQDGSKVYLNAGSTLQFPSAFAGNERRVKLNGEGYFEVAPNKDKKFIVETESLQVEVLGTVFNLKSYADDSKIYTTLLEGKVAITGVDNRVQILSPNEHAIYNKSTKKLSIESIDTSPNVAWKDGLFYFKDSSLEDIMKQLSRWYDLRFEFEEPGLDTVLFNGKMKMYDSVEDVLRKFEKVGGVSFDIQDDHILIKKIDNKK